MLYVRSSLILGLCRGGTVKRRKYTAVDEDFSVTWFNGNAAPYGLARGPQGQTITANPLFGWLWTDAITEFAL